MRFIEPADWIAFNKFPLISLTEGQSFQGWNHPPCSSSSRQAPAFADKKPEPSEPKWVLYQPKDWTSGWLFILPSCSDMRVCECESVLGYIQSFRGVSVSVMLFVSLPAVFSVSLCDCPHSRWRRQYISSVRKRLCFTFGVCFSPAGEKVSTESIGGKVQQVSSNVAEENACCLSSWVIFLDQKTPACFYWGESINEEEKRHR